MDIVEAYEALSVQKMTVALFYPLSTSIVILPLMVRQKNSKSGKSLGSL